MSNRKEQIRTTKDKSSSLLTGGHFALGFVTCFVTLVLLVSASRSSPEYLFENYLEISTLLIASSSLFIAYFAVREQKIMRQAGTDPVVLAHIAERDDTRQMTMFCLSNVGAGAALDVSFRVFPPDGGFDPKQVITPFDELSHPIKVILQGKAVSYNFGLGHVLTEQGNEVPPFLVQLSYKSVDGTEYTSEQTIDVRELRRQPAHDMPIMRVVKELEAIRKTLQKR